MQLARLDVCCTLILCIKHIKFKHYRLCSKHVIGSLFNMTLYTGKKEKKNTPVFESCWQVTASGRKLCNGLKLFSS